MGAPAIPEVSFREFCAQLRLEDRRIPLQGTLETTFRCNLDCVHCYVNRPAADREARTRELPLERLLTLLDEIAEAGCFGLLLTGGEVLVRSDFPTLYLAAVQRGIKVTVFTNATLVTDRIAELFAAWPPERVEVSLYGMRPETYERITRVPGSHARCLAGIRRLHARGIPLKLKSMAMTWNRDELPAMQAFAQKLGAPFAFDAQLNARLDCGASRSGELQLPAGEVAALDLQDPARAEELRRFCGSFVTPPAAESQELFLCGAGLTAFTVDPAGKLQLCPLVRRPGYDLRVGSFVQGWNEAIPPLRFRRWQRGSPCRRCSLVSLCGNCPGAAELEHGDLEATVGAFCRIAHARAHAVLGEGAGHRADAACCLGPEAAPPSPSPAA